SGGFAFMNDLISILRSDQVSFAFEKFSNRPTIEFTPTHQMMIEHVKGECCICSAVKPKARPTTRLLFDIVVRHPAVPSLLHASRPTRPAKKSWCSSWRKEYHMVSHVECGLSWEFVGERCAFNSYRYTTRQRARKLKGIARAANRRTGGGEDLGSRDFLLEQNFSAFPS